MVAERLDEAARERFERSLPLDGERRSVRTEGVHLVFSPLPPGPGGLRIAEGDPGEAASADAAVELATRIVVGSRAVGLCRDAAGMQALHHGNVGGAGCFASSPRLLRSFGLTVSRTAAAEFLQLLYLLPPRTIYQELRALACGEAVEFRADGARALGLATRPRFWMEGDAEIERASDPELIERYERLLRASLRLHCPEPQRGVLLLSGGKDSTALAIAAAREGLRNLDVLTVAFPGTPNDESEDARAVAEHLGLRSEAVHFSGDDYVRAFPRLLAQLGQPMGDPAALPLGLALDHAAARYQTCLDGTGQDWYLAWRPSWAERSAWRSHRLVPGLERLPFGRLAGTGSFAMDALLRGLGRAPSLQFLPWEGFGRREIARMTGVELAEAPDALRERVKATPSAIAHKAIALAQCWEPETVYRKLVDLAQLRGLAARHPFLGPELVRFLAALPRRLRHDTGRDKVIVRELLARHAPERAIHKRKGSFVFPLDQLLLARSGALLDAYLSRESLVRHGLVEPSIARAVVDRYRAGDRGLESRVFALLLLHGWAEHRDDSV